MQTTLNNVISRIIDYRGKTPLKLGYNWVNNGKYIALSAKNVKTGKLVNLESAYHGDEKLYKLWMKEEINRGDILLTSEAPFGQVYFWDSDEKIILSQRLFCLTPTNIVPQYLYYYMCSDSFQNELLSRSTGSTVTGLRQPALLACSINVPNTIVQQHIVGAIGSVDDLIEKNEEIIDKTNKIISHYFETIPVSSASTKLKDMFRITIGRTPPTKEHQWFLNGGFGSVPWLSIKDMDSNTTFLTKTSQYLTKEAVDRFNIPLVEEGDVLLSFKLTVGRVEISSIEMVTNEAIACFKSDTNLRNYLYCYLKKCNFLSDGDNTSSIGQAVNSTIIKNFPFSVPTNISLAEFNEKTMSLFKLVEEKQKENILLQHDKQALLTRYFGSH